MLKKLLKKNKHLYKLLLDSREVLRILYNTKTRSRFLWNLRKGDTRLTLNYPLDKDSVVFDVGAYKGEFTSKLLNKFDCNMYLFEPLSEYFQILNQKFGTKKNVKIFNYGLLDDTSSFFISNIGAGSSLFFRDEETKKTEVKIKSIVEFLEENSITSIDLLYMNIEGSEYKLLDSLIREDKMRSIKHLQVQFHNYIDNAVEKRKIIRKELSKTHVCKFNFPFIWERWDLKTE